MPHFRLCTQGYFFPRCLALVPVVIFSAFALISVSRCSGSQGGGATVSPGGSARDYLTSTPYTSLVIEMQSVSGFAPTATAKNNLISFLQARLNKPIGVTIVDETIASPGQSSYSLDDVRRIETASRKLSNSDTKMTAYFLFLDGNSTSDSSSGQILGTAYAPSSMVIYEKTIQSLSGTPVTQPSTAVLESTVLEHEFGHLLGLVNTGTVPQNEHQDSAHGAHCSNTACLMYWNVDTSGIIGNLLGGTVPSLDADCLADLKANGGK
jgi:hypothetical protein